MSSQYQKTLSVLTYNIWGLKIGPIPVAKNYSIRLKLLPTEVSKLNADIILFQEVWCQKGKRFLINEFKKKGYQYSFYKSKYRTKSFKLPFLGNGLLTLSKYPIDHKNADVFTFKKFTAAEEWFAHKGALFHPIKVDSMGTVDIINTHLGSIDISKKTKKSPKRQKKNHLHQMNELTHFIHKKNSNDSLIVGADLNISDILSVDHLSPTKTVDESYHKFINKLQLIDSFRLANPQSLGATYTIENNHSSLSRRLDYILHRSNKDQLKAKSSKIVLNKPVLVGANKSFKLSDHFGVLSEYFIK